MFAHPLAFTRMAKRVAPLALLGAALACDRTPTAPPPPPPPRIMTSLGLPQLGTGFDGSQYFGINVQLAAQQQHGSSATAVQVSGHLYGWRAQVGSAQYSIDMRRAVRDQFGSDYVLGAVGVGIYDWRAVHWSALSQYPNEFVVIPVMPIASDRFFDVTAVAQGLANLKSVLLATRNWYALRVGKTFRMLQPLVVFNQWPMTSTQWDGYSASNAAAYQDYAWNAYASVYPQPVPYIPGAEGAGVVAAVGADVTEFQVGDRVAWATGTASYAQKVAVDAAIAVPVASSPPFRPVFAITAPIASSIGCPTTFTNPQDFHCSAAEYDIGHWLGVTLGLADCVTNPTLNECVNSGGSIMQVAEPWLAGLTAIEIAKLSESPFFF